MAGALALGGCSSARKSADPAAPAGARTVTATPVGPGAGERPVVRPADLPLGRIVTVNSTLRFVVVDFPIGRLPALEQKLSVYRLDQKVGEIKVSGPYRGTTVAADLVAGEARFGDNAKPQ